MNIPIEIVRKGEETVNKYVELKNKKDQLYKINNETFKKFFDQIENIKVSISNLHSMNLYRSNPVFNKETNQWELPNLQTMSNFSDAIWTFHKNIETVLNEYGVNVYEYTKVCDELEKL
jgi:hypothetical protein